ncbi:MAG: hypothetical protein ACI86C_001030 [Candidatus Latescibacterota bacterium]|jgi:hypothetical protein
MWQTILHYGLHLLFPLAIAIVFFRSNWKIAYVIMLATMLVDLDHLLASPVFEAERCSINFHPLHTYWAIGAYVLLLFMKKTRVIAVGLLMHMVTDFIDCL